MLTVPGYLKQHRDRNLLGGGDIRDDRWRSFAPSSGRPPRRRCPRRRSLRLIRRGLIEKKSNFTTPHHFLAYLTYLLPLASTRVDAYVDELVAEARRPQDFMATPLFSPSSYSRP